MNMRHNRLTKSLLIGMLISFYLVTDAFSLTAEAAKKNNGINTHTVDYIDKDGELIISLPEQEHILYFSDDLALMQKDGKQVYIDRAGKTVLEPTKYYSDSGPFADGLATVRLGLSWGYINKAGEVVVKPVFRATRMFHEGFAAVKVADKQWCFIEHEGRLVLPANYQEARPFSEGLAAVQMNGRWGYIDKHGMQVIACRYSAVHSFADGRAAVCLYGRWGFIDKKGKMVVPAKYLEVADFYKDFAGVIGEEQE